MAKLARTSGFGDFLTTGGVRSTANLGAFLIDAGLRVQHVNLK